MASQNYQNRNKNRKRPAQSSGAFKWMFITGLLIGLVVFVVYLKGTGMKKIKHHLQQHPITAPIVQLAVPANAISTSLSPETIEKLEQQPDVQLPPEAVSELERDVPQFDFYTILPEKEVVVPEHEIITRVREEQATQPIAVPTDTTDVTTTDSIEEPQITSPTKSSVTYMMQAGSFKNSADAEKMRMSLEAMGIDAKIERAKVGETIYHRIKAGPYTQMSSVSNIRARLKQNGIDVIVTETGGR